MQSIGERFEEARKRKGISLREAAEATKIRSDFLANFEQNQLDFELPEIYKRGFIKNYSNYLKLDTQSILTEYNAQLLSMNDSHGLKKTSNSELFGSLDLSSKREKITAPSLGKISTAAEVDEGSEADEAFEDIPKELEFDNIFYIKAGLVVLGILAFLIVIIWLISAVLSSGDKVATEMTVPNTSVSASPELGDSEAAGSDQEIVSLIANDTVYVLVKQRDDDKKLVQKTLSAGEKVSFTKQGLIDIYFTVGNSIEIIYPNGERFRPEGEGAGKTSIP